MVAINADEKKAILQKYPDVCIARTMRQDSKRHHYYMEEARGAMAMLRALRGEPEPRRRRNRNRKRRKTV